MNETPETDPAEERVALAFIGVFCDEHWFIVRDDEEDSNVLPHQAARLLARAAIAALELAVETEERRESYGFYRFPLRDRFVSPWIERDENECTCDTTGRGFCRVHGLLPRAQIRRDGLHNVE